METASTSSELAKRVLNNITEEALVSLLVDLINIPSPPGEEEAVATFLADKFRELGLRALVQDVDDGRANAVGVLRGKGSGLSLMFNGHLDTSIRGGELYDSSAAWHETRHRKARVEDGCVFGPGAMNMKGSVAAFTVAAGAIKKAGVELLGDLILAGVSNEICVAPVDRFTDRRLRSHRRGSFHLVTHGITADMAIVGEPSEREIYLGHPGLAWVRITTHGTSANTVRAHEFPNPIIRMMRVVETLQRWIPEYQEMMAKTFPGISYREAGRTPVQIAAIEGGSPWRLGRSAEACSIYLDFRTKQPLVELKRELRDVLDRLKEQVRDEDPDFDCEIDFYLNDLGDVQIPLDHLLVQVAERIHQEVFGESPYVGHRAIDSDAIVLARAGIPSINYGVGHYVQLRSMADRDEWVSIADLVSFAKAYALIALDICARPASRSGP